ncbi:uncharacterized protein N7506_012349 [Penicillium brevicompactum]|uniref:uncharacterized protein n=1 Tax=Penicillium brevicompactum TaxID=5074 RepID=UPI00254248D7|nr:uncharacterized protein N7506_012349 [Penicillium brevicompactum]KAJ5319645.1 hypothetical protein N7506_012349 [Penicillium brevicompactum]
MVVALCSTLSPGEITRRNGVASACSIPTPYTGKVDGPRPHRCGDRSPGAFWCPASLESVDHWPLAIPDTQIPGGSRPAESAVRRRARGVRTPSPEDHMPQPDSARKGRPERNTCVRTGAEGLSGGNWMVVHVFPVRRGCRCDRTPRASLPFNYILPPRGSGPPVLSAL